MSRKKLKHLLFGVYHSKHGFSYKNLKKKNDLKLLARRNKLELEKLRFMGVANIKLADASTPECVKYCRIMSVANITLAAA